ncbi:hypothetical protein L7F22_010858 [Adiantum nelumboides]|nr:hypothetical protein [Adiantum nelumboides]
MAAILHPFYKTPELFADIPLLTLRSEYLNLMLSEDDQLVIDGEMSSFMNNLGPTYLRSVATRSEATRLPLSWWQNYGRQGLPQLCKLALRVLSQDCSVGACERNWSAYSLVHTKIRNRLSTTQLEKLVYCRSNMRLVRSFHALGNLKQFQFQLVHVAGKKNVVADALSRRPHVVAVSIAYQHELDEMRDHYSTDEDFVEPYAALVRGEHLDSFSLKDGFLMFRGKLCVSRLLRQKVMTESHSPPYAGHRVIDSTIKALEMSDIVILIGEDGKMVGKMSIDEALFRARGMSLDLVQLDKQDPPCVKIVEYSKLKYELQKRKKEQQKKSLAKRMDLKELKMRVDTWHTPSFAHVDRSLYFSWGFHR